SSVSRSSSPWPPDSSSPARPGPGSPIPRTRPYSNDQEPPAGPAPLSPGSPSPPSPRGSCPSAPCTAGPPARRTRPNRRPPLRRPPAPSQRSAAPSTTSPRRSSSVRSPAPRPSSSASTYSSTGCRIVSSIPSSGSASPRPHSLPSSAPPSYGHRP